MDVNATATVAIVTTVAVVAWERARGAAVVSTMSVMVSMVPPMMTAVTATHHSTGRFLLRLILQHFHICLRIFGLLLNQ
jgi:ABC-type spermidine/putrescine transport system permease subunit II